MLEQTIYMPLQHQYINIYIRVFINCLLELKCDVYIINFTVNYRLASGIQVMHAHITAGAPLLAATQLLAEEGK